MKKILLSFLTIASLSLMNKAQAQCSVSNPTINIKSQVTAGGNCTVTFDFSFRLQNNNGNKIVVIQAWLDNDYPNYWNCTPGNTSTEKKAPQAADLKESGTGPLPFINLAFNNDPTPPVALTSYGPDNTVPLTTGYTVTRSAVDAAGFATITLSNVVAVVPGICGSGVSIRADLWSSQAGINSGWSVHCVNCNNLYAFNYPSVVSDIFCTSPLRTYNTTVTNINTNQTITVTWEAYFDLFPFGGSKGTEDVVLANAMTTPRTLAPGAFYNETRSYNIPVGVPSNSNLWVEVATEGQAVKQTDYAIFGGSCIPLPVSFKAFNASRQNASNVSITWTTASEQNSKGFNVQKNVGGEWKTIAFVFSQADGGNSSSDLTYSYKDANSEKGITQYRIQQVDLDGNAKYSDIRAIRGEGSVGKIVVYPNPSIDGKLNVVFESSEVRDVQVNDMQGRVVKSYKGITNNILVIEKLTSGFYTIKVTNRNTAASSVEKVVVK